MAAEYEVDSFVKKFMNLSRKGETANLSLNCEHGRIVVNLQLHLHQSPPGPFHRYPPHRPKPRPYHHPSPSRVRRSERRRAQAIATAEQAIAKNDKTEQVSSNPVDADNKTENCFEVESEDILVPAEQAASVTEVSEGDDAEEAFDNKDDEKTQFQQREADKAEQAKEISQADSTADEKVSNSISNKSEGTTSNQQPKNLLICNYCNEGFVNEALLRDHTEIIHRSGRIRYRIA